MSSPLPSHQVSEDIDLEDPFAAYSAHSGLRSSTISDTADIGRSHSRSPLQGHNRTSNSHFSVKDLGVKAINGHTSVHARPFSYNPSRQLPALDVKHRPAYSLDSPGPRPAPSTRQTSWYLEDLEEEAPAAAVGTSPVTEPPTPIPQSSLLPDSEARTRSPSQDRGRSALTDSLLPRPRLERSATSWHTAHDSVSDYDTTESQPFKEQSRPLTMSSRGISPRPGEPALRVELDGTAVGGPIRQDSKKSKSPNLSGFFGWNRRASEAPPDSPTTTFSDSRSVSPRHSPKDRSSERSLVDGRHPVGPSNAYAAPHTIGQHDDYFQNTDNYYGLPSPAPEGHAKLVQVEELLKELQDISTELAASIRREMELEDEVDRYKSDAAPSQPEHHRRTSDYYSDSGASTIRLIAADSDHKLENLEKLRRQAEQEKAQLRLKMSSKAQEELNQRNALETQIRSLEQQLKHRSQADDQAEEASTENLKRVESNLEATKRKLNEERQYKQNFEELVSGMRQQLESYRNERDNLAQEVIPQLKSRIEGLEAQNAEMQNLTYENSRVQQENQSLRNENTTLANARRLQLDLQQSASPRFRSIAEEEEEPLSPKNQTSAGLSRSNSLARSRSIRNRPNSLHGSRDGVPTMDAGPDSQNDFEVQRDALHRTLQALILRQETMTRTHEKQLRKLVAERDNAYAEQRRKNAFYFEIQNQRHELNQLRRRADDAMESKWNCEKGLSGLKMDLDRALQETSSLQDLVNGNDILVPDRPASSDGLAYDEEPLEIAYNNLKDIHDAALQHVQATADTDNPDTNVAALLASSATRMQMLTTQIESQLSTNKQLQDRFQTTISRGVSEQRASAKSITDLETALRAAEEEVVTATNTSEDAVAEHEDHVRTMRSAADEHKRGALSNPLASGAQSSSLGLGLGLSTSTLAGSKTPFFSSRMPRLHQTTSGKGIGVAEASKTEGLEQRVAALEKVARSADGEMQGLLERMERARVEVGGLQGERDEAIRETRRLQREIIEERERLKALAP